MNILVDGGKYFFYNDLRIEKRLPTKNFELTFDMIGNCFLQEIESFKMPEKIYETDEFMRSLISKTWDAESKNLGVLLTGTKGQGKSLNAKILCQQIGLPVICINKQIPLKVDFVQFLNSIKQDFVLYIDEFEKLFSKKSKSEDSEGGANGFHTQESFLTFMDGVLTNENKILFLLTTDDEVTEFFINRPSRIKFLKEYDDLPEELFFKICEDKLFGHPKKEELIADLESNISLLSLNIDTLISILTDIKNLELPFSKFCHLYNYVPQKPRYEVYIKEDGGDEELKNIITLEEKVTPVSEYVNDWKVEEMLKYSKEEIVFKNRANVIKGEGKNQKYVMVDRTIRLVFIKKFSKLSQQQKDSLTI